MQAQIRRVGIALLIAFLLVFGMLNYVQIFAAEDIAGNNANKRGLLREYSIKRGSIFTVDGVTIAKSIETNGEYKYQRTYPEGDLYGHITGFYSLYYGSSRIEASYNEELLGDAGVISMQDVEDRLFGDGEQGDDVRLSIHSELQQIARDALGDQRGSVVALDPNTGEVRAMWSNPSFDPSGLASFDAKTAKQAWESFEPESPSGPLISGVTSRGYPPGSTFKVVTTAAALESGRFTARSTFPDPQALELPLTDQTLMNFTKTVCDDGSDIDLFRALEISCDTTYGMLGLRIPDEIRATAEEMGFNDPLPFDVGTEPSEVPEVPDDEEPLRAYVGIGQGSVVATPLQAALIAATVANEGRVPRPRLVTEVVDPSGGITERFAPETIGTAMSEDNAEELTKMMVAVVKTGTGTAAQMEGVDVAGKTGTAQSVEGAAPHAWFICFAPADDPQLAVAVIVENGGTFGSEATGGQVAAPIAREILAADREIRGW